MKMFCTFVFMIVFSLTSFGSDDKKNLTDQELINSVVEQRVATTSQPAHQPNKESKLSLTEKKNNRQIQQSNTKALLDAESSLIIPKNIEHDFVVYPIDWSEKTKKREKNKDGIIYNGPVINNKNGSQEQLVIYDITDLIADIPNFSYGEDEKIRMNAINGIQKETQVDIFESQLDHIVKINIGPTYNKEKLDNLIKMIKAVSPDAIVIPVAPEVTKQEKRN